MRKPRVILTDEDRERPHGELAEKYGCTPRTIANARKRQGFPPHICGRYPLVLAEEDRGRPLGELARKYGCTPRTIINARKRQGFPVPVRGKGVSASLSMYLDAADTAVLQAHAGRAGMAPQALLRNKLLELIYTGKTSF